MENKIQWESWNVLEDEMSQKLVGKNSPALSLEEENEVPQEILSFSSINPVYVSTPFGNYDPDTPFRPASRWSCWIGHTNFRLTKGIVKAITQVEGIAALKIMDRYTFCIGVAKMFKIKNVASDIERMLCSVKDEDLIDKLPEEIKTQIEKIKNKVKDSKYWSIFIDTNNEIYHYSGDSFSDFKSKSCLFEKIKIDNGGYLLKSDCYNEE